jgi:hypothetical protein
MLVITELNNRNPQVTFLASNPKPWVKGVRSALNFAVFPIVWLATRLFHKTDIGVRNNANSFQAVYTK